jgi:tetratricopeptide (TPR) repeat protein
MIKKRKQNGGTTLCLIMLLVICLTSCKKEWLDVKPDISLVVPTSISDYQALLDNSSLMNTSLAGLGTISDDNFYLTAASFKALTLQERSAYTWADTQDFYGGNSSSDWLNAYNRILRTNIVLDGLEKINLSQSSLQDFNQAKGGALFLRSLYHFSIAQVYCSSYNNSNLKSPGIPLKLTSNVNLSSSRGTVEDTYQQILKDAKASIQLLPEKTTFTTRPSKAAAYGLVARIYLSMEEYDKSALYADSCLRLKSNLLDYSKLSPTAANPFPRFNDEVIFHITLGNFLVFRTTYLIVDPSLLSSYSADDLRKSLFFITVSGNSSFKGSYDGSLLFFGGIATDEIYLIRAECNARLGKINEALQDLNVLLKTRWRKDINGNSTYTDQTNLSKQDCLSLILKERRKQLCFRGLRWTDLRRLNRDVNFATTITRNIEGKIYTLLPNSLRYNLPIEDKEVTLGGLEQNIR